MRMEEFELICTLDIYKKLYKNDKILYSYFEKCDCVYGKSGLFYKSIKDLSKIHGICKSSISRSKQRLIYYGLISIVKHYKNNGHRGIDYIHVNSLSEIYEHLKKDTENFKDQTRILSTISSLTDLTKTTTNVGVV